MNVTIYGSGYVGLVTAACLAQVGNNVLCVDINEERVKKLQQCIVPIHEPGLQELIQTNVEATRIEFTLDANAGIEHGLFQFISVGTPPDEDGSADLQHVLKVAETIGQGMNDYKVIVNKSTVPVGTAEKVSKAIKSQLEKRESSIEYDVVSNPEFLKEGAAIEDFMKPDRIIVGVENPRTAELMRALYAPFNRSHDRVHIMEPASAELTKYAANAILATKISFMNELANIAERLGADIEEVRLGIGSDPRIGYQFIYPGCGYGGSCFPKDVKALQHIAKEVGYTPELVMAVDQVNQNQKNVLFEKINKYFNGDLKGKVIALWGLAFKPNTDDMREASSRKLMESLWEAGAKVQAYDPVAMDECRRIYGDKPELTLCDEKDDTLNSADALVLVTEWSEFKSPNFDAIKISLSQAVIFDGRNVYEPGLMQQLGFKYYAIGRGDSVTS
ncbi:MAG: UDP-glucose/GDP-mannose dehydrogenase family protein [Gammaproteobacteria bacterium]|nr:UDP-glucose/GDP-mannose dehydrogenase family protein [Gammaproteobacteria bacterium]